MNLFDKPKGKGADAPFFYFGVLKVIAISEGIIEQVIEGATNKERSFFHPHKDSSRKKRR